MCVIYFIWRIKNNSFERRILKRWSSISSVYVYACVCVVCVKVLCLYLRVNVGAPKMNVYLYVCMHECGSQRQPVCHSSGALHVVYRESFLLAPGITEWTTLDVQETPGIYLSLPFPCWDYKIISPHPAVFTWRWNADPQSSTLVTDLCFQALR